MNRFKRERKGSGAGFGQGRPFGREFGKRFSHGGGVHGGHGPSRRHGGMGRRFHEHHHGDEPMSRAERGERTREDILDAAAELFAKHGYEGVSMRDLAMASGASQPLLHFHFGTKRDLYEAVQARVQSEYSDAVADAPEEEADAAEFLLGGVASRIRYAAAYPDRSRMMLWEMMEGHQEEPTSAKKLREQAYKHVKEAQAEGLLKEEIKPAMLAALLAGAIQVWPLLRDEYGAMLPKGEQRHADDWYIDEMLRLMIYGAGTDAFRKLFEAKVATIIE